MFAVLCSLVMAVVSVDVLYPDIVAADDSDDSPVLKKSTAAVGYGKYIHRFRSRWLSGRMPDCGARGPRFESHRGRSCLS